MWRPTLEDFVAATCVVLDIDVDQAERLPGLPLAESALEAPFAGFGDEDAYPGLELKAAVLLEHLARNHPLPDGNKRVAFALMIRFLERNGRRWGEPDLEDDAGNVRRVAAGEAELREIVAWIRRRSERA